MISALANGSQIDFYAASATTEGAATWHSLREISSIPPAGGTPATLSGVVCDMGTSGSIGGTLTYANTTYLLQGVFSSSVAGKIIVYDRLWHNSGLTATNTASVAICTTKDITRPNSGGADVEMWGQIYAPPGATAATWSVQYQNQAGVSARVATYSHPANAETTGQMFPFVLVSSDTGVQIVQKQWCSVSAGGGGNWGVVLMRRIAEIPLNNVNVGQAFDFAQLGMPTVYSSACLAAMVCCTAATSGIVQGMIKIGNG